MVFDLMKGEGKPRCSQTPNCFGKIPNVKAGGKHRTLGNLCHPCGWYLHCKKKYEEHLKWIEENGGNSFRIIDDIKFIDDVMTEEVK